MVSGFSIVKNGEKFGYPYKESLLSLAPLVDEIVVAVGDSDDSTTEELEKLAKNFPRPLRLIDSPWDKTLTTGGLELSRQTNIALSHCAHDICFYLQADEVLFDEDYPQTKKDLIRFAQDEDVAAMALRWLHFYGNYSTVVHSRKWYRSEVRVIKRSKGLLSFGDAMGFRKKINEGHFEKPLAALSSSHVGHYGWVRPPQIMAKKSEAMDRLWHGSSKDGLHSAETLYDPVFGMRVFNGSHPKVMQSRVQNTEGFNPFLGKKIKKDFEYFRQYFAGLIEDKTGWRPGEYKGYKLVKHYDRS